MISKIKNGDHSLIGFVVRLPSNVLCLGESVRWIVSKLKNKSVHSYTINVGIIHKPCDGGLGETKNSLIFNVQMIWLEKSSE